MYSGTAMMHVLYCCCISLFFSLLTNSLCGHKLLVGVLFSCHLCLAVIALDILYPLIGLIYIDLNSSHTVAFQYDADKGWLNKKQFFRMLF